MDKTHGGVSSYISAAMTRTDYKESSNEIGFDNSTSIDFMMGSQHRAANHLGAEVIKASGDHEQNESTYDFINKES